MKGIYAVLAELDEAMDILVSTRRRYRSGYPCGKAREPDFKWWKFHFHVFFVADILQVTLFIERGSPWENGYIESFNGKLRDELLDREIFTMLTEAKVLIEQWRREYNHVRPHSALKYQPPVPEVVLTMVTR